MDDGAKVLICTCLTRYGAGQQGGGALLVAQL